MIISVSMTHRESLDWLYANATLSERTRWMQAGDAPMLPPSPVQANSPQKAKQLPGGLDAVTEMANEATEKRMAARTERANSADGPNCSVCSKDSVWKCQHPDCPWSIQREVA